MIKDLTLAFSLLIGSTAVGAADCSHGPRKEALGDRSSSFVVRYDDDSTERLTIKYSGAATLNVSQTGKSSSWKHPVDNRQCHWDISGHVQREVCVVSRSIGQQCDGKYSKIFNIDFHKDGRPFRVLKNFQGENCNKACGKFNSDFASAKSRVTAELNDVHESDLKPLMEEIRRRPGTKAITN